MNMLRLKKQLGQSLMETIVAIGVMLIVIIAILGLTVSSIAGQKENEQQVVANNLAREGVELVRNIRDSNWLNESVDWDEGIDGNSHGIIDVKDSFIDYDSSLLSRLYIDSEGLYLHDPDDPTGRLSPFSRIVTTQSICLPNLLEDAVRATRLGCLTGELKVGIKVTSRVNWRDSGRPKSVFFESLLYDWK